MIVRMTLSVVVAVLMLIAAPFPFALAVDEDAGAEPRPGSSEVTMAVAAGLGGYVDPSAPVIVDVELSARSLIVGKVELDFGGLVSLSVEVPAGSVKRYELEGATPSRRRQVTVRLLDEGGNAIAEEVVRIQIPATMLVGLAGIDGIETPIRSAATVPLGRSVEVVRVGSAEMDARLAVLSYMVVGPGSLSGLDGDELRSVAAWVRNGGRLYGPAADISVIAEPVEGAAVEGTALAVTPVGLGEIGVLEAPADLDVAAWGRIMRDRPSSEYVDRTTIGDATTALIAAASSGREATVPALPWLLAGILVFIVLVGPVNVIVLRAFGRPEWAWVTIPVLSFVFLGAFWLIGRAQIVDFSANHAAVVIDDGAVSRTDAGLVVQVADAGEHVLALQDGWQARPSGGTLGGAVVDGVVGDGEVAFSLDDLGLGTTQLRWSEGAVALDAEVLPADEGLEVTVTNRSPWTLWAWGVVVDGMGYTGQDALAPGAGGKVTVRRGGIGVGYEPAVSEAVARRPYDETVRYAVVQPMALYAEQVWPASRDRLAYVFGLTDERALDVEFDGRVDGSTGTTLLQRRIDFDPTLRASLGSVRPEVMAIEGASSVERYGNEVYAYGADSVVLAYQVPPGAPPAAVIDPSFTQLEEVEVYDWATGEFVPFTWGSVFDPADLTSAGGELFIRAAPGEEDEFFDDAIRLQAFAMRWVEA